MQGETGWSDYGWRQYMPEIGRWNGMDQLSESYASYSPYAYVVNSPIMMFDPDGRITQNWLNGIYGMSPAGKTTYSNFSSNGMSAWANYESLPFGEASQLYNMIDRGGSGNYTYWTGGDSAYTPSFKNGEWNLYGNLGTMHQIKVTGYNDSSWDAYKDWTDKSATAMEGMFQFMADQRTALYNKGYWIDNLGELRSVTYAGRAKGSLIGLRSDYLKATVKFGKYAERAGMVGNVISAGEVTYGVYEDGWKFGKNAQVATAGAIGGIVGAGEGAIIGAYIGSFIPVPGAGTILGLIVGAGVGYIYSEIATQTVEKMYE